MATLDRMVRKGFPGRVTFEQKPEFEEGVNHKGEEGLARAKVLGWHCSWWVWGKSRRLLRLEQSEEASKTGSLGTCQR